MAFGGSAYALDNEHFAKGIGGVRPMQWKHYEPLQKNAIACLQDNKLDTPICRQVSDRVAKTMHDAVLQAAMLNAANQDLRTKFCDSYLSNLVIKQDEEGLASYAILVVDSQLKYGSGLYGPKLPDMYLGKIISDSLYSQHPCKK